MPFSKQTSTPHNEKTLQADAVSVRSTSTMSSLRALLPKKTSTKDPGGQAISEKDQRERDAVSMYAALHQ
jgi:hypothetical protein